MPTAVGDIRLAPVNDPGANLYNSYHYLTQVSGLYAQAAQYESDPALAAVWRELCDSSIIDLGELFYAWEAVLGEGRTNRPPVIDQKLGLAVGRACKRVAVMAGAINVWTPMPRWTRVLALLEGRWLRFLGAFAASSPAVKAKLLAAQAHCSERSGRLKGLAEAYKQDGVRAQACFKLVEQDDLFGGKTGT